MRIKNLLAGVAITAGLVAGAAATASATAWVYVGHYATQGACNADGAKGPSHPDWTHYECRPANGGFDLFYTTG